MITNLFADGAEGAMPFALGQVIQDSFRIEGVLGGGGMGVVYAATDIHLQRRVAVKAPRHEVFARGLHHEAQALAVLRHSAFPALYWYGHEGEVACFAMERVFGPSLEEELRERRLSGSPFTIAQIVDLLIAIASGLAAAHRASVTHRDLKPSNILLAGERVVLIDFGLFIPEPLVGSDNMVAGSVHSIAPEVVLQSVRRGHSAMIDLYALGALAFELLTDEPPFMGDTIGIILAKHVCGDVPDPRRIRPILSDAFATLVMALLAKDPADRPPSAEAVLWQLEDLRDEGRMRLRPTTVLVLDGDLVLAKAIAKALEQTFPPLLAVATADPEDALPGDVHPPDILVLDLDLPVISGMEVCMALHGLPRARRPMIIAMGATARAGDLGLLSDLGVHGFIAKDDGLLREVGQAVGALQRNGRGGPACGTPRTTQEALAP